jgi:hypothetical protein
VDERQPNTIFKNVNELEEEALKARTRAKSLADFNSYFLSSIVNVRLGLPVLFIRGNDLHESYKKTWMFFLNNIARIGNLEDAAIEQISSAGIDLKYHRHWDQYPFWYFCDSCDDRVKLNYESTTQIRGECPSCRREYAFGLEDPSALLSYPSRLAPLVILDDISDILGLNASGGVLYIGGAEHTIIANLVASGLNLKVFPQAVWRPHTRPYGISEFSATLRWPSSSPLTRPGLEELLKEVDNGRMSMLYYLANSGEHALLELWTRFLRKCEYVGEISSDRHSCPLLVTRTLIETLETISPTQTETDSVSYRK